MDVSFYVHSPIPGDYAHYSSFGRINEPTQRKVDLAKFAMLKAICHRPNLFGRITFNVDVFDDDDHRFAYVVADWKERLEQR